MTAKQTTLNKIERTLSLSDTSLSEPTVLDPWLILFDCDGTLVDSEALIVKAMQIAFENVGFEPPPSQAIRSVIGLSLPLAIEALGIKAGKGDIKEIGENYKTGYSFLRDTQGLSEPLFEGVEPLLADLNRVDHYVLGIATGKSLKGVGSLLDQYQLHSLFQTIQTSDNAPSKPHPAMITQALQETGIAKSNAIMIGDTSYDMEMALSADVPAIGVTWGHHSEEELSLYNPHSIVQDMAGLRAAIGSIVERGV